MIAAGSDWPIVPMKTYIRLIERVLKEATSSEDYDYHRERIFYANARELFIMKQLRCGIGHRLKSC
jgi:predicted TIM-barrel fold metal-dependent hydrolase